MGDLVVQDIYESGLSKGLMQTVPGPREVNDKGITTTQIASEFCLNNTIIALLKANPIGCHAVN